ncbi:MAG: hypothetical protein B6D44_16675 [Ignavibacteriales bacterium UTCHB2]|jgi:V8-like Glu-specific endopeptidase|nr:MAG: hypothetical protein BWY38_01133 [Ignavibacteria bacterium ADurb.Bin266]OQY69977.1 MAG: hypothetical protein B6D44_16675 [Ignavibacteriales bacterium UTCHB2]
MKAFLQYLFVLFTVVFFFLPLNVFGQPAPLEYYIQGYKLDSGNLNGNENYGTNPELAFSSVVEVRDIPWIQLHFDKVNLGKESYIIITSLFDHHWQKLDATSMEQWNNYSAFFNGNTVKLELFVAPFDKGIFISIDEVVAGKWSNGGLIESQCGPTDDRILSNQPATGRLLSVGCTAWIIPNGKFATAGHCLSGSGANVVEFNVPLSLPNGTLQHPGPEDQYSVNASTKAYVDGGIGNDWGVFEVYPNSITGLMPKQAQGAFWPLVQDLTPDSIRITGYGVDYDNQNYNQVQQTHVGPNAGSSGTTMRYVTDTEGGNSGSPVIDALNNVAVGIHTHGGCTTSGGNNNGTSTFNTAFWTAADEGAGGCPVELPSNPNPSNNQTNVPLTLSELTWSNGAGANTNELYFGTNPNALTLVQSGTLANSWTITGVTFAYGTTYYWRVIEIGDSCNTNGALWSFTTVQDPNLVEYCESFNNLSNWTIVGPMGMTNWTANNSANAGGTPPELRLYWSPSFTGKSLIRSNVLALINNSLTTFSFRFFLDYYAAPSGTVTVGITYDNGVTEEVLYQVVNPTTNVGPSLVTGTFTTPALGSENAKLQISYDGYIYNIDYIYWDDLCLGQIIPVELTSFIAKGLGDEVVLNWITATETNNQGFEVERAVNTNSDNKDWKKIGFVSGYGTTTEMKLYTYTDTKLNSGKYVYRLKQIDFDGTVKYSQEVNAEVSVPLQYALEQNYPNPFNPNTTIKYSVANEGFVNIAVFNLLGEKVSTLVSENQKAGNYEVNFNASMLPSGVYFYSMEAGDFKSVRKMLLMK